MQSPRWMIVAAVGSILLLLAVAGTAQVLAETSSPERQARADMGQALEAALPVAR